MDIICIGKLEIAFIRNPMNSFPKKLNLGSGYFPKEGYLNIDYNSKYPADIFHNLENFPWPIPDNHFDLVEMDHVLEHLSDLRKTFLEINRVMAPKGKLIVKVPHFSRGFTHWDHKHGFDISFPLYFDDKMSGGFHDVQFREVSIKLTWFGQPELKKGYLSSFSFFAGKTNGSIFDFIGNINLYFTSRLFCYWVGGYDEIEFVFEKNI